MAKEGKTAEQIVTYYYTGISIEKASPFIRKF
jgi:stage II sporulation protein D